MALSLICEYDGAETLKTYQLDVELRPELRTAAIEILEQAGLPTSEQHITKLWIDLSTLADDDPDPWDDWHRDLMTPVEMRDAWVNCQNNLQAFAQTIELLFEFMLGFRDCDLTRTVTKQGAVTWLPDDACRRLWEMRQAAIEGAERALKASKGFEKKRRSEHFNTRVFMLLRELYLELGGSEEIGAGPLYRFVKGVVTAAGINIRDTRRNDDKEENTFPDAETFRITMDRAVKRKKRTRERNYSPFISMSHIHHNFIGSNGTRTHK